MYYLRTIMTFCYTWERVGGETLTLTPSPNTSYIKTDTNAQARGH